MSNKLTIQINDLSALERLIGGDTEVELDIRQSVVEAFTKKHLKSLLTNTALITIRGELTNQMRSMATTVARELLKEHRENFKIKHLLNDSGAQLVRTEVQNAVREIIRELVQEQLQVEKIRKELTDRLEIEAKSITNQLGPKVLQDRLDELVKAEMRKRLNL